MLNMFVPKVKCQGSQLQSLSFPPLPTGFVKRCLQCGVLKIVELVWFITPINRIDLDSWQFTVDISIVVRFKSNNKVMTGGGPESQ